MEGQFSRVAIVGLGLIGGSLAQAIRKKELAHEVIGVGRNEDRLKKALGLKIIDRYLIRLDRNLGGIDLVVVATPVGLIAKLVEEMAPHLSPGTIVTDVGSVKATVVEEVERVLPAHLRFLGGHPIAGTENAGFESSFASLFEGARHILTPTAKTDPKVVKLLEAFWTKIGSHVELMDTEKHDRIFAAVSHLPHLIAYCLVNTILEESNREPDLLSFSAGGFRDFTRIAASHPVMWRDIMLMNKNNLLSVIDRFEETLSHLKGLVEREDADQLTSEFERSRHLRRQI
jgi:prephenate dehydrogenase